MKKGICIKCGGSKVLKMDTLDSDEIGEKRLRLIHRKQPENWVFTGRTDIKLEAYGCFDCGYVEFYMKQGEFEDVG